MLDEIDNNTIAQIENEYNLKFKRVDIEDSFGKVYKTATIEEYIKFVSDMEEEKAWQTFFYFVFEDNTGNLHHLTPNQVYGDESIEL